MTKIVFTRPSTANAMKLLATFTNTIIDEQKYVAIRARADGSVSATVMAADGHVTLPVDGATPPEPMDLSVNVQTLAGLLAKLETPEASIAPKDDHSTLVAGRQRYKLARPAHINPDLAPEVTIPYDGVSALIRVSAAALINAMVFVEHAAARKDVRHYLQGVCLRLEDGFLRLAASDGHRLARADVGKVQLLEDKHVPPLTGTVENIMPIHTVRKFLSLLPADGEITLGIGSRFYVAAEDGTRAAFSAVEGRFPQFDRLIPDKPEWAVAAESTEIAAALDRALFMHRDGAVNSKAMPAVRVDTLDDGLGLYFEQPPQEFDETVAAEVQLAGRGTGMAISYLREAALSLGGKVRLAITKDDRAAITLRTVDRDDRVCVIMPLVMAPR